MNSSEPIITAGNENQLLHSLKQRLPGYVPGWLPEDQSPGAALMRIFARHLDIFAKGLNKVPARSQMAFLDMLGMQLLPAQAARAPLVFTLTENAPVDVTLPRGSQVAVSALRKPPASSSAGDEIETTKENIFATTQTVTLSRSRIAALYSLDPRSDEFVDHTAQLTAGFTLFDDLKPTEHAIYLGHQQFLALGGDDILVLLTFSIPSQIAHELKTRWEYLTEGGWTPLQNASGDDTTDGMRHDGLIILRRECGPKAKQETIEGRTAYWLRGQLTSPLLPDGTKGDRTIPIINDIRARVGFTKRNLTPETAFADGVPLDISKEFSPFSPQPIAYATFYVACKEAFERKGAQVRMEINLSEDGVVPTGTTLNIDWEYFDGALWQKLSFQTSSGATKFDFTTRGTLIFTTPRDWAETNMNGEKNYWLRAHITEGNYGVPPRGNLNVVPERQIIAVSGDRKILTVKNEGYAGGEYVVIIKGNDKVTAIVSGRQDADKLLLLEPLAGDVDFQGGTILAPSLVPGNMHPPTVKNINLSFTYLTDPFELDHCLSVNDSVFEDHTEDIRWPDRLFQPFRPVEDLFPAVHFNFDRRLPAGLVSLYLDIPQNVAEENLEGSPYKWEYRSPRGWSELSVLDGTNGFRQSGMIQFIGPPDAIAAPGLGGNLFHVRAHLMQGQRPQPLPVDGVWINAVWAEQQASPREEREELGISDGNPNQTFSLRRTPVLEGQVIEVQEWIGRGENWRNFVLGVPEEDLRFERDPATGVTTAVWVRWHPQTHLYKTQRDERHYSIERARGLIRFGNGVHGLVPSAGNRIIAAYSSGGNAAGNVLTGAISELRTAVPFLQSVTNPIPASGGADIESAEHVRRRGAQWLRHQDRAISTQDCEWLAREASPDVARVCCLPIAGPAGQAQRGWITLIIAPNNPDPQPLPSPEFQRRVRAYLATRVPATVAHHVRILAPQYVPVSVRAEIVPSEPGAAAQVESSLRSRLNDFLHPLRGGINGRGWEFGQAVYLSQIARVIESTPGVDYARDIRVSAREQRFADFVPIDRYALVAAGDHELKLIVGGE